MLCIFWSIITLQHDWQTKGENPSFYDLADTTDKV